MTPFIFIAAIIGMVFVAALGWFLGLALLEKMFGPERVARYIKMRIQGPFVPTPEDNSGVVREVKPSSSAKP